MKASIGTLHALGLKKCKTDAAPTTAYLLSEETCNNSCKFCSQAKDSKSDKKLLSRVAWPTTDMDALIQELGNAYKQEKVKRTCIQVVNDAEAIQQAKITIDKIVINSKIPICVSASIHSLADVKALLDLRVDKVSIALDAVTPEIYERIKGGSFEKKKNLLVVAAKSFPGRISTHVIVGLGETEKQMLEVIHQLLQYEITIALFAFTPVKGAEMEACEPPAVEQYRRVQVAFYLLKKNETTYNNMKFNHAGQVIDYGLPLEKVTEILTESKGIAFETTGCDDCNRPYYNEKPGGVMYNYPRPLTDEELQSAIRIGVGKVKA